MNSTITAPTPNVVTPIQQTASGYRLPEANTLQHAMKLAIVEDKPVMMDYWTNSLDKKVLIGVKFQRAHN